MAARCWTDCEGFYRRDFLKIGAAGLFGLSLPDLLRLVMAASPARQAGAAIGSMLVYIAMALILAVRPRGLFPVRG